MDERTFRSRMTDAIARINELPVARRDELLALAQRNATQTTPGVNPPSRARKSLPRD